MYKYDIVFNNNKNEFTKISRKRTLKNSHQPQFKLHWTKNEVLSFAQNVQKEMISSPARLTIISNDNHNDNNDNDDNNDSIDINYEYDALIFVVSSHGCHDGIYDSNSNPIPLTENIFQYFFGNQCAQFLHKPKIFFVDACRSRDNRLNNLNENYHVNVKKNSYINGGYHNQENCRFIYGNPKGYSIWDAGTKGGNLIRSVKSVFQKYLNQDQQDKKTLDDIIDQIRIKYRQLVSEKCTKPHLIEDKNQMQMHMDIRFSRNMLPM